MFHYLPNKDIQEAQSSSRIPIDLKEEFKIRISGYLAVKDILAPQLKAEYNRRILKFIRDSCIEKGIEKKVMTRIYKRVKKEGLENVVSLDIREILSLDNIGKSTGGILYEIVSYCQDSGLGLGAHNNPREFLLRQDLDRRLRRKSP